MKIVFYDTETSGTDPEVHDIIQIAAVAFDIRGDKWEKLNTFERKMMFDTSKASLKALEVNCFSADVWEKEAIEQRQGLLEFDYFIKEYKDVWRARKSGKGGFYNVRTGGHNIIKFDDRFVRAWYKRHDKFCPFDYQEIYDTLQLAKWRMTMCQDTAPENYKLETLCKLCKVPLDGAHDALEDIVANARLAWRLTRPSL